MDSAAETNVIGPRMKLIVKGIDSSKTVKAEKVDLTLQSIELFWQESFSLSPYVKNQFDTGNDLLEAKALKGK